MLRCEFFKLLEESQSGRDYLDLVGKGSVRRGGEKHHIYPRSFEEGNIQGENIVTLTVRDHLLAHYYLAKAIPCQQTCHAFRMMWDRALHTLDPESQEFFTTLEEVAKLRRLGRVKTPEVREKQSRALRGRITISRSGQERKVHPEELQEFLDAGWKVGRAGKVYNPSLGKVWVCRDGKDLLINPEQLKEYIEEGWRSGKSTSSTKGKIRMTRGTEIRYATEDTVQQMERKGFVRGVPIRRYRIEKPGEGGTRLVLEEELQTYLDRGWVRVHTFGLRSRKK